MYITEVKLCTITLSCFYFLKKKNQSVSIFKTEIAQLQTQENAWKNEMEFLQDKYTRNKTKKKWTILIEKTYYNIILKNKIIVCRW